MYSSSIFPIPEGCEKIQVDYRIQYRECAHDACDVLLVWMEHGQEGAEGEFRVATCTCDHPTVCCANHVKTYVCPACHESSSEEAEEPEVKRSRTQGTGEPSDASELQRENEELRERLRQYEEEEARRAAEKEAYEKSVHQWCGTL